MADRQTLPVPPAAKRKRGAPQRRSSTLLVALGAAAAVAIVLVAASLLLGGGGDEPPAPTPTTVGTALVDGIPQQGTVLGDPTATVTLLQYEDVQCPFCKRYTDDAFPGIVREYVRTGKVKVDFRGLAFLGEDSNEGLRGVLAAARQGKAWQLIELLYDSQGDENSGWVTEDLLRSLAAQIAGLDVEKMLADAQTDEISAEIDAVSEEAQQRQVPGTPSFYVQVGEQQPYEVQPTAFSPEAFRPILDDALAR